MLNVCNVFVFLWLLRYINCSRLLVQSQNSILAISCSICKLHININWYNNIISVAYTVPAHTFCIVLAAPYIRSRFVHVRGTQLELGAGHTEVLL